MSEPVTVSGRTPAGDFGQPVDDMVRQYVKDKWGGTNDPVPSINPPYDLATNVRFSDFDYDGNATYHVKVKEDTTRFNDELIAQGFLWFVTPVNFLITARRLRYGKTFEQLDNIRLEIVRIIGTYKPDDISGIPGMDIVDPGDVAPETQFTNRGPRSVWRAQVVAEVYYGKQWLVF